MFTEREVHTGEDVSQEDGIVWLEDPEGFDYVRELFTEFSSTRRRRPRFDLDGRMVGYAVLRADARSWSPGYFRRRVLWVKPYDRSEAPADVYSVGTPCEAVDPRTVAAGSLGRLTERAIHGQTRATKEK